MVKKVHDLPLGGRREILGMGAALLAMGAMPAFAASVPARRQVSGFVPDRAVSEQQLADWLQKLHGFGPVRATGTAPCRAFEEYLAAELGKLGLEVKRHSYRLKSWDCDLMRDCSITLDDSGRRQEIEPIAYYPFSASTRGKPALSGKILYAGEGEDSVVELAERIDPAVLAESIVLVDMPVPIGSRSVPKFYPESFPATLPPQPDAPSLSSQNGRRAMEAVEGKCRGLILCYSNVSDEAARYNYLPFGDPHRRTTALWVGGASGRRLRVAASRGTVTMRCDAVVTPDARADTLVVTVPGLSDETIFLTTQTDGPNEVNENGALGILALVRYAVQTPPAQRKRTIFAAFPTGHYARGAVSDTVTGSGHQATTVDVMKLYPEIMKRAVGYISLEQMGAMDWQDLPGGWGATGQMAREYWHITPGDSSGPTRRLFMAATAGENPRFSRSSLIGGNFPPGEGGAPRAAGIPGVGLLGIPSYFFRADPSGVIDKLNPRVMKNQVDIATKLMILMDRLTPEQLRGVARISEADIFG